MRLRLVPGSSCGARGAVIRWSPTPPRWPLRQANQARTDFAIIESDLEAIHGRLTLLPPTYKELAKMALLIAFVSAVLGIVGIEAFWRYFPACGST
jgi:hypothetical protein